MLYKHGIVFLLKVGLSATQVNHIHQKQQTTNMHFGYDSS